MFRCLIVTELIVYFLNCAGCNRGVMPSYCCVVFLQVGYRPVFSSSQPEYWLGPIDGGV